MFFNGQRSNDQQKGISISPQLTEDNKLPCRFVVFKQFIQLQSQTIDEVSEYGLKILISNSLTRQKQATQSSSDCPKLLSNMQHRKNFIQISVFGTLPSICLHQVLSHGPRQKSFRRQKLPALLFPWKTETSICTFTKD